MLYISKYDADSSITWLCIVCWSMNVRAVPKHVLTFSFLSPPPPEILCATPPTFLDGLC